MILRYALCIYKLCQNDYQLNNDVLISNDSNLSKWHTLHNGLKSENECNIGKLFATKSFFEIFFFWEIDFGLCLWGT